MSITKKLCICAACIALCCVLPAAFHAVGLGSILSPLHIPVFLCALLCSWQYGLACGLCGTLLSSLLTSMPPAAALFHMVPELCAYGLLTGLLFHFIRTGRTVLDIYLALVPAMVLGRVVGGAARALFYLSGAEGYSLSLWVSVYFVESFPAIVLHLAVVPALTIVLMRARLAPQRCVKEG